MALSHNPWNVNQIEDFLLYCCPECEVKCGQRQAFVDHALNHHPLSFELMCKETEVKQELLVDVDPLSFGYEKKIDLDTPANPVDTTMHFDVDEVCIGQGDDVKKLYETTPLEIVTCYICQEVMTQSEVRSHFVKKHDMEKNVPLLAQRNMEVQCYNCGEQMAQKDMKPHMLRVHKHYNSKKFGAPRNNQCLGCSVMFLTADELNMHLCNEIYNKVVPMIEDPNECPLCKEKMVFEGSLRTHVMTVHGTDKKFKCSVCGFESRSIRGHQSHVATNHQSSMCSLCPDLSFKSKIELKQHEKIHLKEAREKEKEREKEKKKAVKETPLICDQCGKMFLVRDSLNLHVREVHTRSAMLETCPKCQNVFKTANELNTHTFLCLESPLATKCKYCHEDQSDIWHSHFALEKHVLDEHAVSCYACDICGNMYSSHDKIVRHKKHIHEGIKIAVCNVCDKSFETNYALKTHIKYVHLRDVTYSCELCQYSCNVKYNFFKHVKVVHKLYTCTKCERRFDSQELLNGHVQADHSCAHDKKPY